MLTHEGLNPDIPEATYKSLQSGEAILDDNKQTWNEIVRQVLLKSSRIYALRGAGAWNGMDKAEIDKLINNRLIPSLSSQLEQPGLVTLMYDGDYDDPQKPDLGYVAGRLLDKFGNGTDRVLFIVVQKESWHPDNLKGLNLRNINGLQYVTYLFPDNAYPDNHSSFTQDKTLVLSNRYEQWYIGASGNIAAEQLMDYSLKAGDAGKRKAILFRVRNNPFLDQEIQMQILQVEEQNNHARVENLKTRLEQRKRIYGIHWSNLGLPDIDIKQYPHLEFEFII